MAKNTKNINDYIEPLHINGLSGRMLRLPAPAKRNREILLVYGHHASIERMYGIAEELNKYGAITLPDLPGFGGMERFYKIGEQATLDNLADYLAAFIKLRYKRRRVTIMATSFGFVIVTKMLQKYPELAKKVDVLISMVGFVHKNDFIFSRSTYWMLRTMAAIFSHRVPAWLVQHVLLTRPFIRLMYLIVADNHTKLKDADKTERDKRIDFEVWLWQNNDIRTHMRTLTDMLTLDLCQQHIPLQVYHIAVPHDRYFDNHVVEQHMEVVFDSCTVITSKLPAHAPTVIATAKEAAPFIPQKIRRLLASSS